MVRRYGLWTTAGHEFAEAVNRTASRVEVQRVCEVGAGANPLLTPEYADEHGLEYVLVDASAQELAKAPAGYRTLAADVTSSGLAGAGLYQLVFSRYLAEHVRSAPAFHRNVLSMLAPGGWALHFFSTLYAVPFLLNRVLPERLGEAALTRLHPDRRGDGSQGKFPAYYRWCRGPLRAQERRLSGVGFEVLEYAGFFGHEYYRTIPGLGAFGGALARRLVSHPVPVMTSYAYVVMRRPHESA